MSLTNERSLRSVNQLPPLTIMPPVPSGLTVGSAELSVVSWLYGISVTPAAAVTAEGIAICLFVDQARAITSYIEKQRNVDRYIEKTRSKDLER